MGWEVSKMTYFVSSGTLNLNHPEIFRNFTLQMCVLAFYAHYELFTACSENHFCLRTTIKSV